MTYNLRNETDIRSFGGRRSNSFEAAENVAIASTRCSASGRSPARQLAERGVRLVPALSLESRAGGPRHASARTSSGLMRVGGRDTEQLIVQERVSVRDDVDALRELERQPRAQGRRRRQLRRTTTSQEVPERQSGVPLSRAGAGPSRSKRATASAIPTSSASN